MQPILAFAKGNQVELIDVGTPNAVELGFREGMARFDPYWQKDEAQKSEKAKAWFAAAFHWGQLAEHDPGYYLEELESACARLGDWRPALTVCGRVLDADPTLGPIYYQRARLRGQIFDFHDATADLMASLVLVARHPIGWPRIAEKVAEYGDRMANKGEWQRAIQAFTDATKWERQEANHRFRLAWAQLAARQDAAFRSTCRELYDDYRTTKDVEPTYRLAGELGLGLDPGPSFMRGLGEPTVTLLLQEMQLSRNAAIVYGACIVPDHGLPSGELVQLARHNVEITRWWGSLDNLGAAQYRAGEYAESIKTLEEAVKLEGNGGTNWMKLFLGMAYQQEKQPDEARAWLEKAKLGKDAGWEERLIYERLRAEAERLMKGD